MRTLRRIAIGAAFLLLIFITAIWFGVSRIQRHTGSHGVSIWLPSDTLIQREGSRETVAICDKAISFVRHARTASERKMWLDEVKLASAGLRIVRGCEPKDLQIQALGILYSDRAIAKKNLGDDTYSADVADANRYLALCANDPQTFGDRSSGCESQIRANSSSQ